MKRNFKKGERQQRGIDDVSTFGKKFLKKYLS